MRLVPVHRLRMDFLGTTEVKDVSRDALEDDLGSYSSDGRCYGNDVLKEIG